MNNRGVFIIGTVVMVLVASTVIMALFSSPIVSLSMSMKKSEVVEEKYVNNITGMERLYSLLKEDMSIGGKTIEYTDIEREYILPDLDTEAIYKTTTINRSTFDGVSNEIPFFMNNETPLKISFDVTPIDPLESVYYEYTLTREGTTEPLKEALLTDSKLIEIEGSPGKYKLEINTFNCFININIELEWLEERTLSITGNSFNKVFKLTNIYGEEIIIEEIID